MRAARWAASCATLLLCLFVSTMNDAHATTATVDVFGRPAAGAAPAASAASADAPGNAPGNAPAVDVFGRAPSNASANATSNPNAAATPPDPAVPTPPAFVLPEPIRKVLFAAIVWQGRLNARIEDAASALRHRNTNAAEWLTLLLMSFGYGVLHAVGPGHGKLVVSTWLGSRNARLTQALMLCGWTAAVQALSAIVLVTGAVWLARAGVGGVLAQAESLEVVSYALLCIAGGWTLWMILTRRDCCVDPTAIELVPKGKQAKAAMDAATDANDASEHASRDTLDAGYLGTRLNERVRAQQRGMLVRSRPVTAATATDAGNGGWPQLLATGFAAGVRPCAGAIFVLVASIGAHVPSIGIAATFAMAAGVALTVTLVGLGSVGANRLLLARSLRYRARLQSAQRVVAIAGATLIVLFAAAQLALLVGGYVAPSLT